MLRKVLRYGVVSKHMYLSAKNAKSGRLSVNPLIGIRQQKLGVCQLNMPDNRNILTEQLMDELFRYFTSYHHEQTIQNVLLLCKQGVFSAGADFRQLSLNPNYMDKLYSLATLLSSLQKPVIAQVVGGVRGAAAAVLAMIPGTLAYHNANLAYDEATRGFIPLCGGSFQLAQLPFNLGSYLALTGDTLDSNQMARLGLINHFIRDGVSNEDIIKRLREANLFFREPIKSTSADSQYPEGIKLRRMAQRTLRLEQEQETRQEVIVGHPLNDMLRKMAKHQYSKAVFDYENAKTPYSSFSEKPYYRILNYYGMRLHRPLDYLRKFSLIEVASFPQVRLPRLDLLRIAHVFGRSTYSEVLDALRQDKSDWAQSTLLKMQARNQLSLALTHKLLVRATSLSFVQCLELEYCVARRLLAVSQLSIRNTNIGSEFVFQSSLSQLSLAKLEQCAETFFTQPRTYEEKLEHGLATKALLPASQHYISVPDAFRLHLNREHCVDRNAINFHREIRREMEARKIDYRNPQFNINILRQRTYDRQMLLKQIDTALKRVQFIAFHPSTLQEYTQKRMAFLNQIDDGVLRDKINKCIAEQFTKGLDERTKGLEEGAKVVGLQRRKNLFKKARTLLMNNVLFKGAAIQTAQAENDQLKFKGPIYFDANGKGVWDSVNPYLLDHQGSKRMIQDFKKGKVSQQFLEEFGDQPTQQSLGTRVKEQQYQKERKQLVEQAAQRYSEDFRIMPQFQTYKQLFKRAARTSADLLQLNEWSYPQAEYFLKGKGSVPLTYKKFAQKVKAKIQDEQQQRYVLLKQIVMEQYRLGLDGILLDSLSETTQNRLREVFPYYFMEEAVPQCLRKCFLSSLDGVLRHFTEKTHSQDARLSFPSQLGPIDAWVNGHIGRKYTEVLRDDVNFITSYLGLLMAKEILYFYQNNHRKHSNPRDFAWALLQQTGICLDLAAFPQVDPSPDVERRRQFIQKQRYDRPVLTFDQLHRMGESLEPLKVTRCPVYQTLEKNLKVFLNFMMDIHSQTKRNITSPQAKLLDFLNRLSLGLQKQEHLLPFTFQSLLLLISKDRRRIYDQANNIIQAAQPQLLLSLAYRQSKFDPQDDLAVGLTPKQMETQGKLRKYLLGSSNCSAVERKKLISSFMFYIMRYDSMLAHSCQTDHFLPSDYALDSLRPLLDALRKVLPSTPNEQWLEEQMRNFVNKVLKGRLRVEQRLSKGELVLMDLKERWVFNPEVFREYVKWQLVLSQQQVEEMGTPDKAVEGTKERMHEVQEHYDRMRRQVKNEGALRRANNMRMAERTAKNYIEGGQPRVASKEQLEDRLQDENMHTDADSLRLYKQTYERVETDVRSYPGQLASTSYLLKQNGEFDSQYLVYNQEKNQKNSLSVFTEELITLNDALQSKLLTQISAKLNAISSVS